MNELAIGGLEDNARVQNDSNTGSVPLRDMVGVLATQGLRNRIAQLESQVAGINNYINTLQLNILPGF